MPKKKATDENITRFVQRTIREIAEGDSIVQKWENTTFGEIQKITNPKKGVLGERLVAHWLEQLGYLSEEHGYDRARGGNNFDLLVLIGDELERVEVKLATQDSSDKYQFNWIAVEHDVAFIVFLGVDPGGLYLSVKTKNEILHYRDNPERGRTLTPVPPRNPTHVKWTASKESADMVEIKTLRGIERIFADAFNRFTLEQSSD